MDAAQTSVALGKMEAEESKARLPLYLPCYLVHAQILNTLVLFHVIECCDNTITKTLGGGIKFSISLNNRRLSRGLEVTKCEGRCCSEFNVHDIVASRKVCFVTRVVFG